jgi:Fur family iron response transcriptional regulator
MGVEVVISDEVLEQRIRVAGLKPTRQRLGLGRLLFNGSSRHVTADELFGEALNAGVPVSLATVYNTLRQFVDAGLLREVLAGPGRSYFDTDISHHHHFYHVDENRLEDLPIGVVSVESLPQPPAGSEIERVDVVIRLRRH